ncbi:MAG: VWA domain-containing protein [Acidobacteriota bacterium]|nr:VWA domain-containing protein [Acidobacteriota bacterium]
MRRHLALLATLLLLCTAAPRGQQAPAVRFRGSVDLVRVDVIVRDARGNVVRGLKAEDFIVTEDAKAQAVTTFDFEEIMTTGPEAGVPPPAVLDRAAAPASVASAAVKRDVVDLPGRRLIVMFFDLSSMGPEDLERAADAARKYISDEMSPADLIAIASLSTALEVDQDFTAQKDALLRVLDRFTGVEGTPDTATEATEATDDPADLPLDDTELGLFNNDRRLRALQVLAEALAPVQQKKSILYFSSGMTRSGSDNQVELRATVNAAVRANAAIYAVDTRGLQAIVPGGDASRASARGAGAFSGQGAARQFDRMFASQETLATLAKDTGGEAFFDSNELGEAFDEVVKDSSAYYVLGYSSTNGKQDGRFRKISVRVRNPGLRIEHRAGYYAARDFTHLTRDDRERQMQEQLYAEVSSTDLPVVASTAWFRVESNRFFVPVSVAIPGSALPAERPPRATLDILGAVRDEQGRYVGRIRDTVQLPASDAALAQKQVQYQTGFLLPPGRFWVKVVARENSRGTIGTFEAPLIVPDLSASPMKVSSVVIGTQIRTGGRPARDGDRSQNPLIRDGVELIPSLTHVVGRDQRLYFYYEVYEPALDAAGLPRLKTSLAFYRGRAKVFESPIVEQTALAARNGRTAVFQFDVPAAGLPPGLYTCQVNIIDENAGRFVFPRLAIYVR